MIIYFGMILYTVDYTGNYSPAELENFLTLITVQRACARHPANAIKARGYERATAVPFALERTP